MSLADAYPTPMATPAARARGQRRSVASNKRTGVRFLLHSIKSSCSVVSTR